MTAITGDMRAAEKGHSDGQSGLPTTGLAPRVWRTLFSLFVGVALVTFLTWTVVVYSYKLTSLQERLDSLERQCDMTEQRLHRYVEEHLDKLLEKVGLWSVVRSSDTTRWQQRVY